ncbi:MAG: riboflavin synthase [Planctomycetota bacterium]|nr:MAG: riboflavin synthase [Planctomycetota bacterium]
MFTGVIRAMGTVQSIRRGSTSARLVLKAPDLPRPISNGSSICVNGVCLTVAKCDDTNIEYDVVPETLSRSTLGNLSVGDRVNLEPSLRMGDPLDGHMVQGHVDGTAQVREIRVNDDGHVIELLADESLISFTIPKGSIAVDGVSLTVVDVSNDVFSIAIIPTTLKETTLGLLKVNDKVNIETDILARTIVTTMKRWRSSPAESSITMDMLREQGFF